MVDSVWNSNSTHHTSDYWKSQGRDFVHEAFPAVTVHSTSRDVTFRVLLDLLVHLSVHDVKKCGKIKRAEREREI